MVEKLNKAWKQRAKLYAEGDKLWAEGDKLRAESVLAAYGNIMMEWLWRPGEQMYACKLQTGEVFEP